MKRFLCGAAALAALVVVAPGQAQSPARKPCPGADALFTHLPTDLASVSGIVPLGNFSPPGHTLPARHIYVYPKMAVPGDVSTAMTIPVRSPGLMEIVAVEYYPGRPDWSLHLKPCRDISLYFFHVNTLAPAIAAAVGDPSAGGLALPDFTVKAVSILVKPGQTLGEAKTFDIGLQDLRKAPQPFVNQARYAVDFEALFALFPGVAGDPAAEALIRLIAPQPLANRCPIDYFKPPRKAALLAKLSDFDGATPASGAPPCHSHMQDIPLSAQGNWFNDPDPTNDALLAEEFAVSLANWNIDPAVQLFSLNENVPGFAPELLEAPAAADDRNSAFEFPVREGPQRSNRRFAEITDEGIYCYDLVRIHRGGARLDGVILLAVSDGPGGPRSQLTLELAPASGCPALPEPWSFSAGAATYYR